MISYSTRWAAASLLVLGLTGLLAACGGPSIYTTAPGPAAQAKAALAGEPVNEDPKSKFRIGHLDANLQPIRGKSQASSPYSTTSLSYRGLKDGKACFAFDYGAQYYRSHGSQKDAEAERAAAARLNVFTFELHAKLDDLDDTWPNPPKTQITASRVIDSKLEDRTRDNGSGSITHVEWLETTIELCGAAPRADADARYLTATRYPPEGGRAPTFFIWVIEGRPRT